MSKKTGVGACGRMSRGSAFCIRVRIALLLLLLRSRNIFLCIQIFLIIGQSIAVMDEQLFRVFGSYLGAGTVASFRYARRVVLLPVGIVAQAVGVASYPTLSKLFVDEKYIELKLLIRKHLSSLFLFNALMAVILIVNSEEIISLVYERGRFTSSDVKRVSSIMNIVALGVIPWSVNQIITRAYYVQKRFWFPVMVGTTTTIVTAISLVLKNNPTEISYSIIIISFLWAYTAFMLFSLKIKNDSLLDNKLIYDIFCSVVISLLVYSFLNYLSLDFGSNILNLFILSIISVFSFIVSIKVFRMKYVNFERRK